jgi:hypothetical protein
LRRCSISELSLFSSQREEIDKEQKKDAEFKRLAENLHHLVSTKRIPGVYKPIPYCNNVRCCFSSICLYASPHLLRPHSNLLVHHVQMPTMKALPIEEHVRGVVKDLLRTRGIAHTGLVTDLNGTKKVPLKGLKYRLSIQVTAPWLSAADSLVLHASEAQ